MDADNTKALTQSQTFRWAVAAIVAYLLRQFALPELPTEVQGEVTNLIGLALDVAIPAAMILVVRARVRARYIIDRVF